MNQEEIEQEIEDLHQFIQLEQEIGQVTPHLRKKVKYLKSLA